MLSYVCVLALIYKLMYWTLSWKTIKALYHHINAVKIENKDGLHRALPYDLESNDCSGSARNLAKTSSRRTTSPVTVGGVVWWECRGGDCVMGGWWWWL